MATSDVTKVDSGPRKVTRRTEVAAPVEELFAIVANPHRHGELDGSGTVHDAACGPDRLSKGAKFSVKMTVHGFPYRITSKVTDFEDNRVVEWRHPLGHRWRWEFESLSPGLTQVTETFDYSRGGAAVKTYYELLHFPGANASGIAKTLSGLRDRYSR